MQGGYYKEGQRLQDRKRDCKGAPPRHGALQSARERVEHTVDACLALLVLSLRVKRRAALSRAVRGTNVRHEAPQTRRTGDEQPIVAERVLQGQQHGRQQHGLCGRHVYVRWGLCACVRACACARARGGRRARHRMRARLPNKDQRGRL